MPNGGVLTLKISGNGTGGANSTKVNLERLIFIKPKNSLPFTISTDKDEYSPGDKVNLEVKLDDKNTDSDEKFFASITVTDLSSFLEVPKHKLMPSLPTMVYLEKEVKQMNGEIDEFQYSNEYLDASFDVSDEASGK